MIPSATPLHPDLRDRLLSIRIFLATALVALLAAGFAAAVFAHAPTRPLMWMVAYLVLVGGVAQAVLGIGQALLPPDPPSRRWCLLEWSLFNAGNLGVIAGTLAERTALVTLGTLLFVASLGTFLAGVRGQRAGWLLTLFRGVLVLVLLGAGTGLALTLSGIVRR